MRLFSERGTVAVRFNAIVISLASKEDNIGIAYHVTVFKVAPVLSLTT